MEIRTEPAVEVLHHSIPPMGIGKSMRTDEQIKRVELITMVIEVPFYLWVELLTHKRFARNAQSARASSPGRLSDQGIYVPPIWYECGKGMKIGDEASADSSQKASATWEQTTRTCMQSVNRLYDELGICKEQSNRLMPMFAMRRGIMTGTMSAWVEMLKLRNHPDADMAMQQFAEICETALDSSTAVERSWHLPYTDGSSVSAHQLMLSVTNIAAVSYSNDGQKSDGSLAERLLKDGHLSPFEHIAIYKPYPVMGAICSRPPDLDSLNRGWESFRAWHDGGFTMALTVQKDRRSIQKGAQELFLGFCKQREAM